MPELSQRPYLLRAMLDWIVDNGWTPHLIVDVHPEAVTVPRQYAAEGYIRLNISASATQAFRIDDKAVQFNARFGGVSHRIHVPLEHVLAIVASENGQGMAFTTDAQVAAVGSQAPEASADSGDPPVEPPDPPGPERPRRPSLKVVK